MQRVKITVDLHPEDYKRMQEAAKAERLPEPEFCALAIHKGVVLLCNMRRDRYENDWPDGRTNTPYELKEA